MTTFGSCMCLSARVRDKATSPGGGVICGPWATVMLPRKKSPFTCLKSERKDGYTWDWNGPVHSRPHFRILRARPPPWTPTVEQTRSPTPALDLRRSSRDFVLMQAQALGREIQLKQRYPSWFGMKFEMQASSVRHATNQMNQLIGQVWRGLPTVTNSALSAWLVGLESKRHDSYELKNGMEQSPRLHVCAKKPTV